MRSVNVEKILGKLEQIVEYRLGKGAKKKHPIELRGSSFVQGEQGTPATDGTNIFLPRVEKLFKKKRDNEIGIANSTAHEADHIIEYEEFFGDEVGAIRERTDQGLVGEYMQRVHPEIMESEDEEDNSTLLGWIDNIVKDRRIDQKRREEFPGVKKHYKEALDPAMEYFRPSIKGLSELDAFREQFLQQSFIGRTVDPVPEDKKELLEECVRLCHTPNSIFEDKEVVEDIYKIFKDNFDIKQKMSRLPSRTGSGDHNKTPGTPQGGYGSKTVKPRQGRSSKDKKPKSLGKGKDKKDGDKKGKKPKPSPGGDKPEPAPGDRDGLYKRASEVSNITIVHVQPDYSDEIIKKEQELREKYGHVINSTKAIFQKLQQSDRQVRNDYAGEDLDYEDYMQSELEREVTGVSGGGRYFSTENRYVQKPAWAILADMSPSTDKDHYNIIDEIKAGMLIQAEALGVTDYPFGLYGFSGNLYVIKDFTEQYNPNVANKIIAARRGSDPGGTPIAASSAAVGHVLKRQAETPRGITIITDGEADSRNTAKKTLKKLYDEKIFPFVIVIGKEFENFAKDITSDIGSKHYVVIGRDELDRLPDEQMRLFQTYGLA